MSENFVRSHFRKISMVKALLLLQAQGPSFPDHPGSPKRRFKFQITSSNFKRKKKKKTTTPSNRFEAQRKQQIIYIWTMVKMQVAEWDI